MSPKHNPKLVVVGLGQELRGDDAVGLAIVKRWVRAYPETTNSPNVQVVFAGLPGVDLLSLLEGADAAFLVDAVHSRAAPGTLFELSAHDLASFATGSASAHGWGVAETLAMAEKLGSRLPGVLILLGIEAEQMELGQDLSATVHGVLPRAVGRLHNLVRRQMEALQLKPIEAEITLEV